MKLAIFTDTYLPQVNGVARTIARISAFLHRENIPHLIFAPGYGPLPPGNENVHAFPALDLPLYPECKIALPSYPQIREVLHHFQPDLIHLVTEFSMGLCGLKFAREHHLPVVASYTTNFPQYLAYYRVGFLEKWAWLYLRWFHNQCQLNYCPSQAIQTMLAKKGFRNLTVWGRGIDTEFFSPDKRSNILKKLAPGKDLFFLYVGRLAPEKDLDILLKAWDMVAPGLPEAALIITGDGPQTEELKQKAGPGVIFTGYRHGEELASIYASSDIFVFPSTTETFGNVVLEAMASGLPVVAAAAGGVKNLLVDGRNALACRPRNAPDMAAAMLKLARYGELRAQMGRRAREYALGRSWEALLQALVDSYRETAAGVHRPLPQYA
ncbi:glycosyltransferase [Desulfofundulus thermobenzoicus]|uniref:Glycosyltransferase n=1 Tax=Desulfofundulus thermobenzoicus TaxID=29376 RepID=A0A6N7IUQ1_9FIRM|nr:glycosyltransferase family 1 protein [Desulfofundulus thermobenzoicus]MQL53273.1 glycosyltransferase [Desulfofundulus thermobenzoicus]